MPFSHDVFIVGLGQTPLGELWDLGLRDLGLQSLLAAVEDAQGLTPQALYVANMLGATASGQANLGAMICDQVGLEGHAEALTVEAAEASGGVALQMAANAIRAGSVNVAAVLGIEKVTDMVGSELDAYVARSLDADFETEVGMNTNSQAALLLQRYLYENDFPREALAGFPMVAHQNAVNNPNAMFRRALNVETYAKAGMVEAPLNTYDIAPMADGGAALILTRGDLLPESLRHKAVRLAGSSVVTSRLALHDRRDLLFFDSVASSAHVAFERAGVNLSAVDFLEYSDYTTLHALLSLEALGLAPRGEGWKLAGDGSLTLEGKLPVATMGGNKARGFTLGASGVFQALEACQQLRGEAGANQLPNANVGMVQSLAGTAALTATHILTRFE